MPGLSFATWETFDIFWISFPAAAAIFAALFLSTTLWFQRRNSVRAAVALGILFAFEGAVAPTLRVMTVTKVADFTIALAGALLTITLLATKYRTKTARESPPTIAQQPGDLGTQTF